MNGLHRLSFGLMLCAAVGLACDADSGLLLPERASAAVDRDGLTLVARIVHVSDTHVMDEESPARFAGAHVFTRGVWRPYESYSTQLFDGIIRAVNRIHAAGREVDFLVHTGDACDNVQSNELGWLIGLLDGQVIDPLSGPDDRAPGTRPVPLRDPHASFQAQGLYRAARHGELPSIPWYIVCGNHDVHALGVLAIFESPAGHPAAPLPFDGRPGYVLPVRLDPLAWFAYGNVTPADPGPPCLFQTPRYVQANPARAYFSKRGFIAALFGTLTEPPGHGFEDAADGPSWYSVSPLAGVRLIGLDSTDRSAVVPGQFYQEGALSRQQLAFLRAELDAAARRGEVVIVATHHPSAALLPMSGSAVAPEEFRALLSSFPNVALHLAGHRHRNRVADPGGYVEIETCSTLDLPQEGRLIELWRAEADGRVVVTYEMFSHLDEAWPALGEDPLRQMRVVARAAALRDKGAAARQKRRDSSGADPYGQPSDRRGSFVPGEALSGWRN